MRRRLSRRSQVSQDLRTTAPAGPIFVWGNAGQIYALSGRAPASQFVIAEFTNATSPRPSLSRAQVLEDVRAHPPPRGRRARAVQRRSRPDAEALPPFQQFLNDCYQKVSPGAAVPNWAIYAGQPGAVGCV
ncbi:MAG: hypothetical protein LC797_01535 [Chloroflexi bacterium]|nr:hypothetical protein [Chloroflexota bacterium]